MRRLDSSEQKISNEAVKAFITMGRRLAAQIATTNFQQLTSKAGWTETEVSAATEYAITRMELAARDLLAVQNADPNGKRWQAIWAAMEISYREVTADLLRASRPNVARYNAYLRKS